MLTQFDSPWFWYVGKHESLFLSTLKRRIIILIFKEPPRQMNPKHTSRAASRLKPAGVGCYSICCWHWTLCVFFSSLALRWFRLHGTREPPSARAALPLAGTNRSMFILLCSLRLFCVRKSWKYHWTDLCLREAGGKLEYLKKNPGSQNKT